MSDLPEPIPTQTDREPYWPDDHVKTLSKADLLTYCETVKSLTVPQFLFSHQFDNRDQAEKERDAWIDKYDNAKEQLAEQKTIASDMKVDMKFSSEEKQFLKREIEALKSAMRIFASKGKRS